jgi:hypothetical protein
MAGPTIDQAFITKFETDLHLTYRQMGPLFRGLVRTDAQVRGSTARFYKLGQITVGPKARNGDIAASNATTSFVTATMADRYALIYLDELDLAKLSVDVRNGYLQAGAAAFGLDTDATIIAAIQAGRNASYKIDITAATYKNIDRGTALLIGEKLDSNNVPRDGRRFCAVTPRGWSSLMSIDQFVRADYNGMDDLPFKRMGRPVRTWNDIHWFVSPASLPGSGTSAAFCYAWHMDAVGHGINSDLNTSWDWENEKRSWSMSGSLSQGATVIDDLGVIEVAVNDTQALP